MGLHLDAFFSGGRQFKENTDITTAESFLDNRFEPRAMAR